MRVRRRIETRYLDEVADRPRRRHRPLHQGAATSAGRCRSGSSATPPTCCPRLLDLDFPADIVTDQTSAHDPLSYVPVDLTPEAAAEMARTDPDELIRRARESMADHCAAMVGFLDQGAEVFDYGNSLRAEAELGGFDRAFAYPGFLPAYIRPLFCEGKGPFRWVALSGDPADIAATDRAVLEEFPDDDGAGPLDPPGRRAGRVPGPAGADLLARLRRARTGSGCASTRWSAAASCRRRSSSVATTSTRARWPRRTARPRRWPTAPTPSPTGRCSTPSSTRPSGATWVSIHHGGGVGIGRSIHAGMVALADGTDLAAEKLERVLTTDPGTGVIRHADAGYDRAARGRRRTRRPPPDGRVMAL